jgi:hypothetical protein
MIKTTSNRHHTARSKGINLKIQGQSLVEFAMVIPLLLLFIFGTFDLGRLFSYKIIFANAAREGAHYLFIHPEDKATGFSGTIAAVQKEAKYPVLLIPGLTIQTDDISIICVDVELPSSSCDRGSTASVIVSQEVPLGLFGLFVQSPAVTAKASMLIP